MSETKIEKGKMDLMGMNIDISQILGEKIIDQYIAQLSPEDMQKIIDHISSDLFETVKERNWETGEYNVSTKVRVERKEKSCYGGTKYVNDEYAIGNLIKKLFNQRIKEELTKKVEEIIKSTDYQDKIDDIANELVEYSINGYKEDMKARIRERLVNNVVDPTPFYDGIDLRGIINQEINNRFNGGY